MKMVQFSFVESLYNIVLRLDFFSSTLEMIGSVLLLFAQRNYRRGVKEIE